MVALYILSAGIAWRLHPDSARNAPRRNLNTDDTEDHREGKWRDPQLRKKIAKPFPVLPSG
jgi:hypothetical protein